jgi:HlyD family secretion protein
VSGSIAALHVDFNDRVRAGQVLAQLDPTFLKAQVAQNRADLTRAEVQFRQALRDSARTGPLAAEGLVSQAELDAALTTLDAARASVESARAALERAETNLRYATISSPIDGVVVSRDVDVGQTVAASLSAPTLYTIAQDLTQMQLEAAVDEADIGAIREGQPADFTVDAYPELRFTGTVHQVRLAPQTISNVVTYTVVIRVDNADLKLLPGMTANVSVLVDAARGVLKVPVMALRFKPASPSAGGGARAAEADRGASGAPGAGAMAASGQRGRGGQARPGGAQRGPAPGGDTPASGQADAPALPGTADGQVYLLGEDGLVQPVALRTGVSDGSFTAVYAPTLSEDMQVVLALESGTAKAADPNVVNPFTPQRPGSRSR